MVHYKRPRGPAGTALAQGAGTQVAQTHLTAGWPLWALRGSRQVLLVWVSTGGDFGAGVAR